MVSLIYNIKKIFQNQQIIIVFVFFIKKVFIKVWLTEKIKNQNIFIIFIE